MKDALFSVWVTCAPLLVMAGPGMATVVAQEVPAEDLRPSRLSTAAGTEWLRSWQS